MKALFTLVFFVLLCACSKTPDIDRVSPNYMRKSALDGEWYMRSVLVDKQHDNASAFVGMECATERVRFELTEKYLNAYRSYEAIKDVEGANGGSQTLIAQFPITSHFDIRRKYNPQNGVQSNVIVENTKDSAWQERDFVRVDWSSNQVSDRRCNAFIADVTMLAISRNSPNDPRDPYRLRVEDGYQE